MLDKLDQWDRALFLFFNKFHNSFFDQVMNQITDRLFWIPLYVLIIIYLIWKFKSKSWLIILSIVLTIVLADKVSSGIFKPTFKRLRPCHESTLAEKVHVIKGCGGMYGFVSSHAANSFALAMFLFLLLSKQRKWVWAFFIWAFIVSYSRIYVGVHYPGDIIVGSLVGIFFAYICYRLYIYLNDCIYIKNKIN